METIVASVWQKSKLLIKGLLIGGLVLLAADTGLFCPRTLSRKEKKDKKKHLQKSAANGQAGKLLPGPCWYCRTMKLYRETITS